jgi:hypothetical protein
MPLRRYCSFIDWNLNGKRRRGIVPLHPPPLTRATAGKGPRRHRVRTTFRRMSSQCPPPPPPQQRKETVDSQCVSEDNGRENIVLPASVYCSTAALLQYTDVAEMTASEERIGDHPQCPAVQCLSNRLTVYLIYKALPRSPIPSPKPHIPGSSKYIPVPINPTQNCRPERGTAQRPSGPSARSSTCSLVSLTSVPSASNSNGYGLVYSSHSVSRAYSICACVTCCFPDRPLRQTCRYAGDW